MRVVKWNPFAELDRARREMDWLFDQALRQNGEEESLRGSWSPAMDIFEDKEKVLVTAELPGLTRDDIQLQIDNNVLTISGERTLDNPEDRERYTRIERAYGRFARSFSLPNTIDSEKIEAKMENGVLRLTLPKRAEAQPRQIPIHVQ